MNRCLPAGTAPTRQQKPRFLVPPFPAPNSAALTSYGADKGSASKYLRTYTDLVTASTSCFFTISLVFCIRRVLWLLRPQPRRDLYCGIFLRMTSQQLLRPLTNSVSNVNRRGGRVGQRNWYQKNRRSEPSTAVYSMPPKSQRKALCWQN